MSVSYKNESIGIAVVGCGNWGKNLIRTFHSLGVLRAICDIDPLKTTPLSEQYQVPSLRFEDILAQPEIAGVVIATPSVTHYELGLQAIKANKHIYIEKPFTTELKQAVSLNHAAYSQQRLLMVGHLLQYHPVFNQLKTLRKEGVLGQLQYISSHRCNFGKFPPEKNVLWDYAPHDVSMVLSLVEEEPEQVWATSGNYLTHTDIDTVNLHLKFPHNIKAHLFVSWVHPHKEQKLIVVGNKGMAVFDDCQPWGKKLQLYSYPEKWVDGLPHPFPSQSTYVEVAQTEPLWNECNHFVQSILQNTQPRTNGEEALKVTSVLQRTIQCLIETEHFMPKTISLENTADLSKQSDTSKGLILEEFT